MTTKYVHLFTEGNKDQKDLLGGKGANLAEMTNAGLPVPPGFTISTDACRHYYKNGEKVPVELDKQMMDALKNVEKQTGKEFGGENPLLVSVRSGAKFSMPGMMDTVLNLGLNDTTVLALEKKSKNPRFAWDSYRRFIQMFSDVVLEIHVNHFEELLHNMKEKHKYKTDLDLTANDLKELVMQYKALVRKNLGKDFPSDPVEQLRMSRDAVFKSWNSDRAIIYRRLHDIPHDLGTAVNIQSMVFGNLGDDSGTGVAFTRDPANGDNVFYGEFLVNAQGEDVVAGIRTPQPIIEMKKVFPPMYDELVAVRKKLEHHYHDMQDFEFTIEQGTLYMLQTRNGKRTAKAAVKIAVDMEHEGLVSQEQALLMVDPNALNQLLHKTFDPKHKYNALTKGLAASPGAAVGKVVFNAETAKLWAEGGHKVILVRIETSPEDIQGMVSSQGILTTRGGTTSHAAVVARGMGKCCVAGAGDIRVNEKEKFFEVSNQVIKEGDLISLNGTTGEVIMGAVPTVDPAISGEFKTLMEWADKTRRLEVRTNADTPKDAQIALNFGAQGIGLCRTEHMFFEGDRITAMREMILADSTEGRKKALSKLLPYQREDFFGLFKVMTGKPVIVRFLDPPLHEFLPKTDKEIEELSEQINVSVKKIKETIEDLHEFNPMLGFRGCRLGVVYPEISSMQAQAIFEAAIEAKNKGFTPVPEIEVPNVISVNEFKLIKNLILEQAKATGAEGKIKYKIGTMIEFPRAAFIADDLAHEAEFMSFGTNDLTQTTLGFSRDDVAKFIGVYIDKGIFDRDPFQAIDQHGVGRVMQMAVEKARSVKSDLDIGICGEHGGEPSSVEFCHRIGLSNVSCSPYRVPIARLAAAQAVIREKQAFSKSKK
ncbi:MAG: pyruvate, phosphate dikinase [Candidatus Diapherotrites archaeon]|uniref:pyruvate, phosphate dikinase n=1 Tax=Candidatus Iainarchaeum sp. TaxID=3101447 RepID=A0A8T4L3H3_9ARCH|nr:pyruvate, phosphate dikinase [Candidatus Diapherotrites archaeon]